LIGVLAAFRRFDLRPLWPLRNIEHSPPRADAGNIDHRKRLAGRNAGRQRRPDGARRQLWNARRHFRRQLLRMIWVDRVDGEPAFIHSIARIDAAPTGTRRKMARTFTAAPAPAGIDRTARTTRQMARTLWKTWETGQPLIRVPAFAYAIIGIDGASPMIKVNWCNPN
jgi:hypothetical protein